MAQRRAFSAFALRLWSILPCLLLLGADAGQPPEESLYLWIDAHQARVLIGKVWHLHLLSGPQFLHYSRDTCTECVLKQLQG